jgi:hypothetical protein
MSRARLLAAALLPLALTAAKNHDPLAGRVAGPPVDCINPTFTTDGPTVIDKQTILYGSGRTVYRVTPTGACTNSLESFSTIINVVYGGQICKNDRFRVLRPGETIPSPFCFYGRFTPFTKPPKAR